MTLVMTHHLLIHLVRAAFSYGDRRLPSCYDLSTCVPLEQRPQKRRRIQPVNSNIYHHHPLVLFPEQAQRPQTSPRQLRA